MKGECVYFIQVQPNGPIKIGWTRGLVMRFINVKAGCPFPVEVIGIIEGAGETEEATLHSLFAKHLIHGEWFRPAPEVLAYVHRHTVPWRRIAWRGVDHFNAALNDHKVAEIRRRHEEGESLSELATTFKVSSSAISSVVKRRTWKHVV